MAEDHEALRALGQRYARAADERDVDALAALFHPDAVIIGISPDSVRKHDNFCRKHSLGIILASDEDRRVIEAYGLWVEKKMYGLKYMGVERTTYLIGRDGRIAQVWHKVKVKGHAEEVLEAAKNL